MTDQEYDWNTKSYWAAQKGVRAQRKAGVFDEQRGLETTQPSAHAYPDTIVFTSDLPVS